MKRDYKQAASKRENRYDDQANTKKFNQFIKSHVKTIGNKK